MNTISLIDPQHTSTDRAALLSQVKQAFGAVPNMFRAVAHSPAALQSMWSSFAALGQGSISSRLGEQIAVAVADRNHCEYCLAAHTMLGRKAGASEEEMRAAQRGEASDAKTAAVLRFALKLVEQRGQLDAAEVNRLRDFGCSDEMIVEVIAHVALNLFTNYINIALAVPVDFPQVRFQGAR